ncbi:MAG: aminotransferase class I/II-fold pyridoxal phosphate-dependent enzyme [Pseudomonadota bacterium]
MTASVQELKHLQRNALSRPSRETSEFRTDDILWLDKNENMDPEYQAFLQNLIADLPSKALFGYPDCHALYKKLGHYLDVPINQLMIAAGSDGVIRAVYEAFVTSGDTVIYTNPTFAMYEVYSKITGAKAIELNYEVSANGPLLIVERLVQAILENTPRLVCIPNPNSPSGTVFSPDELYRIIETAHDVGAVILIDEAYHPFYGETVLPLIAKFPQLIVARSFSKAWGCAGIRLGYGIASKAVTDMLHKIRPMYEAGALSIMIAERLLDNTEQMLNSVRRLNEGKEYFLSEMRLLGFHTLNAEGNFLHVAFGKKADAVHKVLSDKVLYRQNFSHPSLVGYSRFSATTKEVFASVVEWISSTVIPAQAGIHSLQP